jgi:hypothetical protein
VQQNAEQYKHNRICKNSPTAAGVKLEEHRENYDILRNARSSHLFLLLRLSSPRFFLRFENLEQQITPNK